MAEMVMQLSVGATEYVVHVRGRQISSPTGRPLQPPTTSPTALAASTTLADETLLARAIELQSSPT
jgi:hypothetical protein